MSRRQGKRVPGYLHHKATGQARVVLSGTTHYLGAHGTIESRLKYDELIQKWLSNGRQLMADPAEERDQTAITIAALIDAYLDFAESYHVDEDGQLKKKRIEEIEYAVRDLFLFCCPPRFRLLDCSTSGGRRVVRCGSRLRVMESGARSSNWGSATSSLRSDSLWCRIVDHLQGASP